MEEVGAGGGEGEDEDVDAAAAAAIDEGEAVRTTVPRAAAAAAALLPLRRFLRERREDWGGRAERKGVEVGGVGRTKRACVVNLPARIGAMVLYFMSSGFQGGAQVNGWLF